MFVCACVCVCVKLIWRKTTSKMSVSGKQKNEGVFSIKSHHSMGFPMNFRDGSTDLRTRSTTETLKITCKQLDVIFKREREKTRKSRIRVVFKDEGTVCSVKYPIEETLTDGCRAAVGLLLPRVCSMLSGSLCAALCLVSSEKASVSYLLSHPGGGAAAVVAVGGAPESLEARPGALTLQLLQRKGFIKLALKHGAGLVPVFSFGENELFDQMENPVGSALRRVQDRLQRVMGVALPLFHARGVFQYSFGLLPYRRPVYTVVGRPIRVDLNPCPTKEDIESLHQRYMEGLTQLFEENKEKYGINKDKHLKFI
ncbi:hypothetical protein Q7C36_018724 [Tachysurus vachellii]|uniref:Acyltransferase n=1 Tax=Tachysurus vachellii TaxID=175792 RepID=A0AA88LWP8_TACVA|nr:hypothetical protein Q7C36_018724 [Tachysurus vachellii]